MKQIKTDIKTKHKEIFEKEDEIRDLEDEYIELGKILKRGWRNGTD